MNTEMNELMQRYVSHLRKMVVVEKPDCKHIAEMISDAFDWLQIDWESYSEVSGNVLMQFHYDDALPEYEYALVPVITMERIKLELRKLKVGNLN